MKKERVPISELRQKSFKKFYLKTNTKIKYKMITSKKHINIPRSQILKLSGQKHNRLSELHLQAPACCLFSHHKMVKRVPVFGKQRMLINFNNSLMKRQRVWPLIIVMKQMKRLQLACPKEKKKQHLTNLLYVFTFKSCIGGSFYLQIHIVPVRLLSQCSPCSVK